MSKVSIDDERLLAEVASLLHDGAVGKRLRHGLGRIYGSREQALRGPIPRHVPAHEFFRRQNIVYEEECEKLLGHVRAVLHTGVDRVVDTLYAQAITEGGVSLGADSWEEGDEFVDVAAEFQLSPRRAGSPAKRASLPTPGKPTGRQSLLNTLEPSQMGTPLEPTLQGHRISPPAKTAPGFTAVNGFSRSSREGPADNKSSPAVASSARGRRTALPSGSAAKRSHASSDEDQDERPKRSRRTSSGRTVRYTTGSSTSLSPPPLSVSSSMSFSVPRTRGAERGAVSRSDPNSSSWLTWHSPQRHHVATSSADRAPSQAPRDDDGRVWPIQAPIKMSDVKPEECVFRYRGAAPDLFFVLRCTRPGCPPAREQMTAVDGIKIFTAYPFRYKRAKKHFTTHRIDRDDEIDRNDLIFHLNAREVEDAVKEDNLEAKQRGKSRSHVQADPGADTGVNDTTASPRTRSRPAARHSRNHARTRNRSRSQSRSNSEEAPPSDPSLLPIKPPADDDDDDNNKQGDDDDTEAAKRNDPKYNGGDKGEFTGADLAAPGDDHNDPPEEDIRDSPYVPPSGERPASVERDAAAAFAVVKGHQEQQKQHSATEDVASSTTYPTRARIVIQREASEDVG